MKRAYRRVSIPLAALAAAAAMLSISTASAKWSGRSADVSGDVVWYQYAAQFTCGENLSGQDRVVRSVYATAINIHNPYGTEVIIRKHVALTFPPVAQEPGQVSAVIRESIDRRAALQVDCGEILSDEFEFPEIPDNDYVQGFLVIESRRPLDVAATYSASASGSEVSVDAETIAERLITRPDVHEALIVCHVPPGNPGNAHEIEIGEDAWPAHREHGDHLGPCRD